MSDQYEDVNLVARLKSFPTVKLKKNGIFFFETLCMSDFFGLFGRYYKNHDSSISESSKLTDVVLKKLKILEIHDAKLQLSLKVSKGIAYNYFLRGFV